MEVLPETIAYLESEGLTNIRVPEQDANERLPRFDADFRGFRFRIYFHSNITRIAVFMGRYSKDCGSSYLYNETSQVQRVKKALLESKKNFLWKTMLNAFCTERVVLQGNEELADLTQQAVYEIDAVLQRYNLRVPRPILIEKMRMKPAKKKVEKKL